jgi:Tfp pilus assembly protein PilP
MKTQTSASAAAQKSSTSNPAAKPTAQAVNKSASQPTAQVSTKSKPQVVSVSQSTSKAAAAKGADQKLSAKVPSKTPKAKSKPKATSITVKKSEAKPEVAVEDKKNPVDSKKEEPKQITMAGGRRDPFISPVVSRAGGSGCSTGKRCLAIDQIALQGIVKSDSGMIAVVINALNKAYFLRENDPVFNGYVVKITGDSIIFKETLQDKLGKPFTREVTKKISTPAV